jgi:hypothetical protein
MFKSVNFNIFDENLQDIVYGEKTGSQKENAGRAERKTEKLVRAVSEIVIRPITERRLERERERSNKGEKLCRT